MSHIATLLHGPTSPFARKARIEIIERGIDDLVRQVAVTVRVPENEVLLHNPTGKVPALIVNEGPDKGLVLLESSLICEYLDTIGDAPPFLPAEGPARWRERAMDAYAHALMDAIAWRTREFRKPEEFQYRPFIAYEFERAERCFDDLESRVDELSAIPLTHSRILLAICLDYSLFRFPDLDWRPSRPRLADWYARMAARPSFIETAP
jgi:glutathione S-transferase